MVDRLQRTDGGDLRVLSSSGLRSSSWPRYRTLLAGQSWRCWTWAPPCTGCSRSRSWSVNAAGPTADPRGGDRAGAQLRLPRRGAAWGRPSSGTTPGAGMGSRRKGGFRLLRSTEIGAEARPSGAIALCTLTSRRGRLPPKGRQCTGGGSCCARLHQIGVLVQRQRKNSTSPVSRLYIAPTILTAPEAAMSASTALRRRMSPIVNSTFLRATASTKP